MNIAEPEHVLAQHYFSALYERVAEQKARDMLRGHLAVRPGGNSWRFDAETVRNSVNRIRVSLGRDPLPQLHLRYTRLSDGHRCLLGLALGRGFVGSTHIDFSKRDDAKAVAAALGAKVSRNERSYAVELPPELQQLVSLFDSDILEEEDLLVPAQPELGWTPPAPAGERDGVVLEFAGLDEPRRSDALPRAA